MKFLPVVAAIAISFGVTDSACGQSDENEIAYNNHCRTCHSTRPGDHRVGPSLFAIFNAQAGKADGYKGYSGSLTNLAWDAATLDRFIADPISVTAGTNMIYPPVTNRIERQKIIEFLKTISRK